MQPHGPWSAHPPLLVALPGALWRFCSTHGAFADPNLIEIATPSHPFASVRTARHLVASSRTCYATNRASVYASFPPASSCLSLQSFIHSTRGWLARVSDGRWFALLRRPLRIRFPCDRSRIERCGFDECCSEIDRSHEGSTHRAPASRSCMLECCALTLPLRGVLGVRVDVRVVHSKFWLRGETPPPASHDGRI